MKLIKILLIVCVVILLWFMIPYSPLKKEFLDKQDQLAKQNDSTQKYFSSELLASKPLLLQKFITYCGLNDKPMMHHSITTFRDVDFLMKVGQPMTKINYTQMNMADGYARLAFIDTKMAKCIPFQGIDEYVEGKGRMRGVVAKLLPIFDVQGSEMNESSLVTILAEGIVCPSFLMKEDIIWQELDEHHLQATITYSGITVSGIFEFDDNGAIISFYSKDRYEENNGINTKRDWIARCGNYQEKDGIKYPTLFEGIWIYPHGEEVYFHADNLNVQYYY